ncbi:MAG TPA: hypothetical protein VNJ07_00495, partial [Chitinophagales bacterium]|nr:hypothetical protein [Chitinophagales bacterium]
FMPEFVYDFMANNAVRFRQFSGINDFVKNYTVPRSLYQDFIRTAREKKMDVSDAVLAEIEADVKILLKAYIARQLWKNDGFYAVVNSIDNTFLRTLEILKNPETLTEN